ncbi:MAG: hypothetical protein ACTSUX_05985 [Promethearchaeota archaeon]
MAGATTLIPKESSVETYFKDRTRYVILDESSWDKEGVEVLAKNHVIITTHPKIFLDLIFCNISMSYI